MSQVTFDSHIELNSIIHVTNLTWFVGLPKRVKFEPNLSFVCETSESFNESHLTRNRFTRVSRLGHQWDFHRSLFILYRSLLYTSTVWRRCIGCHIFTGHFPQKSPVISGFFAKRDLQLKVSYASSTPCTWHSFSIFQIYIESLVHIRYGVALVSRIDSIIGLFCKEPYKRDAIL